MERRKKYRRRRTFCILPSVATFLFHLNMKFSPILKLYSLRIPIQIFVFFSKNTSVDAVLTLPATVVLYVCLGGSIIVPLSVWVTMLASFRCLTERAFMRTKILCLNNMIYLGSVFSFYGNREPTFGFVLN